jgi:cell division protein FtsL
MNEERVPFFEQLRAFLRRNATVFLVAALVLLLIQDVFGTHGVLAMRRAQKEAAAVKQEIDRMKTENQHLQDNVKSLKSDPQAIEKIAREENGLARPGEIVFKLQPKQTDVANPAPATPAPQSRH